MTKKQDAPPKPVNPLGRGYNRQRTLDNKDRRMAKDARCKAKAKARKQKWTAQQRELHAALLTWTQHTAVVHLRRYFKRHPQGAITFAGVEYGPGVLMLDVKG